MTTHFLHSAIVAVRLSSRPAWLFRAATAAARAIALVLTLVSVASANTGESLKQARDWTFQLQKFNLDRLARSSADLLVIDYSRDGSADGAFTRAEVDRLRKRADGGRRLVIAYFSIGEAETYRFYWQDAWRTKAPDWLLHENCRWPENFLVKFWDKAWKEIIFAGKNSYLAKIIEAGFDGVYLDRVDAYWDLRETHPSSRADMVQFVREMAETARKARPGFIVIAQNAESLLSFPEYRAVIDAIAKEDLLYGVRGTGRRNEQGLIGWSLKQLKLLEQERKPIFVIEYLRKADQIASVTDELLGLGYRPTMQPRALDGTDPLAPRAKDDEAGTPEYMAKHCR